MEEILCGNIGVKEDGGDKRQSVCPNVTIDEDVNVGARRFSPGLEINQILLEEFGGANVTSTPKRAAWPIYTKRRSSGLRGLDEPVCKAVLFDVVSGSGTVGGIELSRGNVTNPSERVAESFVTSGGVSTLEGIAQRQADGKFVDARSDGEREGMVLIPPVEEMFVE